MGYANPAQINKGIHLRQFSRAFIVRDPDTKASIVYVNIDACMLSQVVKLEVMSYNITLYESRREKSGLPGFRLDATQIGM